MIRGKMITHCATGNNPRIKFKRNDNQRYGSYTRDLLRYRIKNLVVGKNQVTIQTSDTKFNSDFIQYCSYTDFDYSLLTTKDNVPDEYLNNYVDNIIDNIQSCIYDYPNRFVHIVAYPLGVQRESCILTVYYPYTVEF